jgi:hypothetical protein
MEEHQPASSLVVPPPFSAACAGVVLAIRAVATLAARKTNARDMSSLLENERSPVPERHVLLCYFRQVAGIED